MKNVEKASMGEEKPAVMEQAKAPNYATNIKSQVLARIGKPPRLGRVEVSRHHGGHYRVNIWEQPEPNKNIAITIAPRIRWSYYLKVSETGEIIDSNPPLAKVCSLSGAGPSSPSSA